MTRVSTSRIFVSLLWLLLGWLRVQVWGFQIVPAAIGIFSGMLVAGGFEVKPLRIIDAKGEYRASRGERTAEPAIVGIVVVLLFWLVGMENRSALKVIRTPVDSLALAIDYLGPAWFGTRGALFIAWETKNGTHILSEGFPSRLYAVHSNSAG